MRILMLHDRYQVRGGEDESTDHEAALLRQFGHEVDLMFFDNKDIARRSLLGVGWGAVWSRAAYRRVAQKLSEKDYDIVHVQNFFPLISPAAHYASKAANKPVVQALRNYRLICLNGLLFRAGHICEDCLHQLIPWPGVIHGCYRSSRRGSLAVAAMVTAHRILGTWRNQVDCFYTPSEFAKDKLIEGGFPGNKIFVKTNLIFPDPGESREEREYAFMAGRLVAEKGVPTVLASWEKLSDPIPLKITGEGPWSSRIDDTARRMPWVENLGRVPNSKVCEWMGRARFVIFPTATYEVFGRIIVEAFAKGTPIIASDVGAVKELLADHRNGLLFEPGNSEDLAEKVRWAWTHPREMSEMGKQARKDYEDKYSPNINYLKLMDIYDRALEHGRQKSANKP
jgi:glycosyltransferase involved in cell wall biosynthesis